MQWRKTKKANGIGKVEIVVKERWLSHAGVVRNGFSEKESSEELREGSQIDTEKSIEGRENSKC